jgi:hypothetical protein
MNKLFLALLVGPAIAAPVAYCQNQPGAPARGARPATMNLHVTPQGDTDETAALQKFDLDFPGGSPRDLVSAIEKATGKPLNALVPKEDETLELPSMKFKAVTVPDLFDALKVASQKHLYVNGGHYISSYSFQTQGHGEDAIWYFHYEKPPQPQRFCRFYQLAQDLENYSIQDITTAIQTGWKLLGITSPPQLKFHPETKLLIGVGEMEQLATIDSVLQELRKAPKTREPARKKDGAPDKQ